MSNSQQIDWVVVCRATDFGYNREGSWVGIIYRLKVSIVSLNINRRKGQILLSSYKLFILVSARVVDNILCWYISRSLSYVSEGKSSVIQTLPFGIWKTCEYLVFNRLWMIRGASRTLPHAEIKVNQPAFHRHGQPLLTWDGILGFLVSLELGRLLLSRWWLFHSHSSGRIAFSPPCPGELCITGVLTRESIAERRGYIFIAGGDVQGRKGRWSHCCSVSLMDTETPRWVLTHTWTPASTDTELWKWPLRLSRRECAPHPPSIWCMKFFRVQFAHNHQGHCILQ